VWQRQAIRHGGKFLQHIVPAIIKPIHSLWNEVIGFFFLCFAGFFGIKAFSYFRSYQQALPDAAAGEFMRVVTTVFFALIFTAFGVSSFRKARKISRS
jgi:hypothetical protein